jgi:hypothetical protein
MSHGHKYVSNVKAIWVLESYLAVTIVEVVQAYKPDFYTLRSS